MPRQKLSVACKLRDLKQKKESWIENLARVSYICPSDGLVDMLGANEMEREVVCSFRPMEYMANI